MAPPKLALEDDERFKLMKFRRQVVDLSKPHHDDYYLLRWLRARSWNVEAAEKMFRESMQWRSFWEVDTGLKTWKPPECIAKYYPSGSTGCDSDGCPVIFVPFSGLDVVGILHSASKQDCVRMTITILEGHLEMAQKTGARKLVVVFDMVGFNLKDYAWRPAAEMVITMLKMYEANYPEILQACYIINAPTVFAVAFSIVKRFLNEYTLGKIFIYKCDPRKWTKVLRQNIPPEILPKHYGGNMVDPDGNPKCPSKIRQGGKVPKSYYNNKFNENDGLNGEFVSAVIKKGKKLALDYIVAEDGCVLKWEFRTDGHDIKFGITQCDEEGSITTAVPFQRVSSHRIAEAGIISCQAPATYTVIFDNSYSLLRSKKLHYNVAVSEPITKLNTNLLPENVEEATLKCSNGTADSKIEVTNGEINPSD